ncbi:3-deoxy-D-manno-octulosonic acid transferase [Tropicimonas sp.]|uniref:3-deoxy-D-manno-octulosonic acid transferase n=1 Tax=Tropicimonas sp. TaxID=2067044 RepID=UPI003A859F62
MDILTIPRLQARFRTQALQRKLNAQLSREDETGLIAKQLLGRSETPRPAGKLVWLQAPGGLDAGAATALRDRIAEEVPGINLLATVPERLRERIADGIPAELPPLESPGSVERFLDHWRPDVCIWFGRVEAPILADACARRGIPMFLQDATAPEINSARGRALQQRMLGLFERILALDVVEADRIRAIGSIPSRIETTGRLTQVANPPACVESERAALADALNTRPVWVAACPTPGEVPAILDAHWAARRTTHRLLLILVPPAGSIGSELGPALVELGWQIALREADEYPEFATDIYIADTCEELGLFYRLSPVTFLGGTLSGGPVPEAMGPATLGSAIIAGPQGGHESEILAKLQSGGACRRIADASQLGEAVSALLEPDTAASLALNAWSIATDGVRVMNRLGTLVATALHGWPD